MFPPLVMVELALFHQCTGGKVPVAAIYWWKLVSSANSQGNANRHYQKSHFSDFLYVSSANIFV
jgi:hypothetical protein